MKTKQISWGAARKKITPDTPQYLSGYFNKRLSECVLDDLEVRALVLMQGEIYFGIIQFDLLTVSEQLALNIYKELESHEVFSRENLLITATHTHTAPEVRSSKALADSDYIAFAAKMATAALHAALEDIQPGGIKFGKANDGRFCFNRRYWMKDGSVVTNPGKLNPDIVKPEGEIDASLTVIALERAGKIAVVLANIVNHTDTIGGNGISADWPGFMILEVQKHLGSGSMLFPLIGCSGNINHFDVSAPVSQTSYREAERIGKGYAETLISVLPELKQTSGFELKTVHRTISVPPREISPAELAEAEEVLAKPDNAEAGKDADLTSEDLARKFPAIMKVFAQMTRERAENKTPGVFRLTGVFMGNLGIISLPCEPFVEIGLKIKKEIFPGKSVMVVSHSNGTGGLDFSGGYIPNKWNYGRGGYETTPRSNPVSEDCAGILFDSWRDIADKEIYQ